ncbi:MAG: MBL fold metallo-hydrolase [SAR324 cluster bacterium]|nr:MBL fold metallo-hydrolase [SAR324 cluster bacterium]
MIKITFLGVGSAFTRKNSTSSILIESGNIKMLVDCGVPVLQSIAEYGITLDQITHVFVTHLHADHIGGMEQIALQSRFTHQHRIKLLTTDTLLERLWECSLKGGLEFVELTPNDETPQKLADYFECIPIQANCWFPVEEGEPLQLYARINDHVLNLETYGLEISENPTEREKSILFTSDTRLDKDLLARCVTTCKYLLHDCQLFNSGEDNKFGVHTSYQELLQLPQNIREHLWLYHFGDTPLPDAKADGFAGFIEHMQHFSTE